jgi:hypothetical protein
VPDNLMQEKKFKYKNYYFRSIKESEIEEATQIISDNFLKEEPMAIICQRDFGLTKEMHDEFVRKQCKA